MMYHMNILKKKFVYNNVQVNMLNQKVKIIRYVINLVNIINKENINIVCLNVLVLIIIQLIYQILKEIIVYQIVQLIMMDIP